MGCSLSLPHGLIVGNVLGCRYIYGRLYFDETQAGLAYRHSGGLQGCNGAAAHIGGLDACQRNCAYA